MNSLLRYTICVLTVFNSLNVLGVIQTVSAGYLQDDEQGLFTIDFQNTIAGIDLQSSEEYQYNSDEGFVILGNTNDVSGSGSYITTAELTPASFEGWEEIKISGRGGIPFVELMTCEGVPATNGVPISLQGLQELTDGVLDISSIDYSIVSCLQVKVSSASEITIIDSIQISWDEDPVLAITLEGPETLVAGQCDWFSPSWSLSYVDEEKVVVRIEGVPLMSSGIAGATAGYGQFEDTGDTYAAIISGYISGVEGVYTTEPIVIENITIPANSIYWDLEAREQGSSDILGVRLCSKRGTQDGVEWNMVAKIAGKDASLVESNAINTIITSVPEPELFGTNMENAFPDNATGTGAVVHYEFTLGNGFNQDIATEDIFNPVVTIDFTNAATRITSATCSATSTMNFQDRVVLPEGFVRESGTSTTAVRSSTQADTIVNQLPVLMKVNDYLTINFTVDYIGCTSTSTVFEVEVIFDGDNIDQLIQNTEVGIYSGNSGSQASVGGVGGGACGSSGRGLAPNGRSANNSGNPITNPQYLKNTGNYTSYGGQTLLIHYSPRTNAYGVGRMYNNTAFYRVPDGYEVLDARLAGWDYKNGYPIKYGPINTTAGIGQTIYGKTEVYGAIFGRAYWNGIYFSMPRAVFTDNGTPYYAQMFDHPEVYVGNIDEYGPYVGRGFGSSLEFSAEAMKDEYKTFYSDDIGGNLNQPPAYDQSTRWPVTDDVATIQMGSNWNETPNENSKWISVYMPCIESENVTPDPSSICYGKGTWPKIAVVLKQKDRDVCTNSTPEQLGAYTIAHGRSLNTTNSDENITQGVFEHHLQGYKCPWTLTPGPSRLILPHYSSGIEGNDEYTCTQGAANRYEITFENAEINGDLENTEVQVQLPSLTVEGETLYPTVVNYGMVSGTGNYVLNGSGGLDIIDGRFIIEIPMHISTSVRKSFMEIEWPLGFENNTQQTITATYFDDSNFCNVDQRSVATLVTLTCESGTPEIVTKKYLDTDLIEEDGTVQYVITAQSVGETSSTNTFLIDGIPLNTILDQVITQGTINQQQYSGPIKYPLMETMYSCEGCKVYFTQDDVENISSEAIYTLDQQTASQAVFTINDTDQVTYAIGANNNGVWTSPFGPQTTSVAVAIDGVGSFTPGSLRVVGIQVNNSTNDSGDIFENQVGTISSKLLQNISNTVETTILDQNKVVIYNGLVDVVEPLVPLVPIDPIPTVVPTTSGPASSLTSMLDPLNPQQADELSEVDLLIDEPTREQQHSVAELLIDDSLDAELTLQAQLLKDEKRKLEMVEQNNEVVLPMILPKTGAFEK